MNSPAIGPEDLQVVAERARRYRIWQELTARYPGGAAVPPSFVRQLGIYGGMGQGVFVDKKRMTGSIVSNGIAVGLNWANGYAEDGLDGDNFIYGYPNTRRPGRADSNEISAVKNARTLDVPIFFIDAVTAPAVRSIRLAWVVDWDDAQRAFVLAFTEREHQVLIETPKEPFVLDKERDDRVGRSSKSRPGQRMFKYRVLKRYGSQCALCTLSVPVCLDAAHLKPSSLRGTDDERNGLVLCKVHHAALDERLIAINPETFDIECQTTLYSPEQLKLEYVSIEHLSKKPALEALRWLYSHKGSVFQEER